MSDNCELKWQPTQDQLDNLILPAYTEMAKKVLLMSINLYALKNMLLIC